MNKAWKNALRSGSVETLAHLLSTGADINARDEHGQTALMNAARVGHSRVIEWLIAHGAALDHTAKYGLSALMLAVVNGHRDVVRALVDAGADTGLCGSGAPGFAGRTALDLALARNDSGMVEILGSDSVRKEDSSGSEPP